MRVDLSSLSDYLDTDTPKKGTILQRKLLNALLSALGVTALLLALMPVVAMGDNGNEVCPKGDGWPSAHFDDGSHTEVGDFGSIEMSGSEDSEQLNASINAGYTVEICVKQATNTTINSYGEGDHVVWSGDLSHWSYRFSYEEPTTTTTEGSTTSTTEANTTTTDSSTTTEPTLSSTTTSTTIAASSTTSTSSPATTTSTTEPTTTSTIQSSSSTTSSDEVLGSTLPFTGGPTDGLSTLALSLLSAGILILLATRRRVDV